MHKEESPQGSKKTCFIISSRDHDARDRHESVLQQAVENAGFKALSTSNIKFGEQLASAIWSAIDKADIILADISGGNPNSFYELGIAQGMGKRTVIVTNDRSGIPSDLSHIHIIQFTNSQKGLEQLSSSITRQLTEAGREAQKKSKKLAGSEHLDEKEQKESARQKIDRSIEHRKSGRC